MKCKRYSKIIISSLIMLVILAVIPMNASAGYPVRNGTVGYWRFDEGSGNVAVDSSGLGNNGSIVGATWTSGQVGSALSFNGMSNYVEVPDSTNLRLTNALSIEAWVYVQADLVWPYHADIVSKGTWDTNSGYELQYSHDDIFRSVLKQYQLGTLESVSLNTWYHVTATYDGTSHKIYLNGVLSNSGYASPTSTNTYPLRIGYSSGSSHYRKYFNGLIDEVRILNRSLTPEEIKEDYKMTKTLFLTTDKPSYNLGETVSLSIGLNYSRDRPPVYASFKLELVEPTGTPDVLIQTPIFSLTPGFNITKTLNYKIPSTIWIPEGEYGFKGTLNDSQGNLIDSDTASFYLNDSMKVKNEINFI